jgi:hypothetical protein
LTGRTLNACGVFDKDIPVTRAGCGSLASVAPQCPHPHPHPHPSDLTLCRFGNRKAKFPAPSTGPKAPKGPNRHRLRLRFSGFRKSTRSGLSQSQSLSVSHSQWAPPPVFDCILSVPVLPIVDMTKPVRSHTSSLPGPDESSQIVVDETLLRWSRVRQTRLRWLARMRISW